MFTTSLLKAFGFNVFPKTIYINTYVVMSAVTPCTVLRGCYTTLKSKNFKYKNIFPFQLKIIF